MAVWDFTIDHVVSTALKFNIPKLLGLGKGISFVQVLGVILDNQFVKKSSLVRISNMETVGVFRIFRSATNLFVRSGLNSHYFHIIGDGHQPNSRGLYTHYKDSLLKVG